MVVYKVGPFRLHGLTAPSNWIERKEALLKELDWKSSKPFAFFGTCRACTSEEVHALQKAAEDIELKDLIDVVDLQAFSDALGYDQFTLPLINDRHVNFCRSTFRGQPCFYIEHSCFEFIYVPRGSL